jgi:hypothetical protein
LSPSFGLAICPSCSSALLSVLVVYACIPEVIVRRSFRQDLLDVLINRSVRASLSSAILSLIPDPHH